MLIDNCLSGTTGAGGGYEIAFAENTVAPITVTFGTVSVSTTMGTGNIKLDFVNGTEIWTDSSVTALTNNITEIEALSLRAIDLTGAGGNEKLFGNSAANVLRGEGGNDTLDGGGNGDTMFGGIGNDTYVVTPGMSSTKPEATEPTPCAHPRLSISRAPLSLATWRT